MGILSGFRNHVKVPTAKTSCWPPEKFSRCLCCSVVPVWFMFCLWAFLVPIISLGMEQRSPIDSLGWVFKQNFSLSRYNFVLQLCLYTNTPLLWKRQYEVNVERVVSFIHLCLRTIYISWLSTDLWMYFFWRWHLQIWGQSCLLAHSSAASLGLDVRLDSASTVITGENPSDRS